MDTVLHMGSVFIWKIAEFGAGFFSVGLGYQPEIPEELLKRVEKD